MAEQVRIVAETRTETGRSVARRLRTDGRVPAVVYGGELAATAVHVDNLDLYHALHTSAGANVLIRLEVDGQEHLTIPREVQRHPVRGDLLHVDFVALQRDQLIRVEIPLHLTGTEDVEAPGVVQQVLYTVPIRCRPLDIPEAFELDVSEMVIGDVMRVEDLTLPEAAEYDIEVDRTVVTITAPTILEEPEEEIDPELAELMAGLEAEDLTEEEIAERLAEAQAAAEEEADEEGAEPEPGEDTAAEEQDS